VRTAETEVQQLSVCKSASQATQIWGQLYQAVPAQDWVFRSTKGQLSQECTMMPADWPASCGISEGDGVIAAGIQVWWESVSVSLSQHPCSWESEKMLWPDGPVHLSDPLGSIQGQALRICLRGQLRSTSPRQLEYDLLLAWF
jgi:hypothetical protein